jgi:hypothetical protein
METHTKHPLLTDTNNRAPFVKQVFEYVILYGSFVKLHFYVLLSGLLYSYMNEFLTTYNS